MFCNKHCMHWLASPARPASQLIRFCMVVIGHALVLYPPSFNSRSCKSVEKLVHAGSNRGNTVCHESKNLMGSTDMFHFSFYKSVLLGSREVAHLRQGSFPCLPSPPLRLNLIIMCKLMGLAITHKNKVVWGVFSFVHFC